MTSIRRLALLVASLGALALLPAAGAGAAETCTTSALLTDVPFDGAACAVAVLHVPSFVTPGVPVTLDGSASLGPNATNPEIAGYEWDFGDDSPLGETSENTTTHTYARGHWLAALTIKDTAGPGGAPLAPSATADVYASAKPVAAFSLPGGLRIDDATGHPVLKPGVSYQFDASASFAPDAAQGGSVAHYLWDWGDGTPPTPADDAAIVSHTFADDGVSTGITLTVQNDADLKGDPVTQPIVVDNLVPVVQLSATPSTVAIGQQLTLSAAGSSDPDGTIAHYVWDLDGDGHYEHPTGTTPTVTAGGYPNAGFIVLGVKAIDDSGDASVKSVVVTITGSGGAGRGGGSGGGGGKGGSGGRGSGGGNGDGSGAFTLGLSGTAIQKLKAVLRRGVGLRASANRTATGTLTLTVSAADAKKLRLPGRRGRKPVKIGSLKLSLSPGRTAKPTVKLTHKAAAALRHSHPRTLRVTVSGALSAGAERAKAARVVLVRG